MSRHVVAVEIEGHDRGASVDCVGLVGHRLGGGVRRLAPVVEQLLHVEDALVLHHVGQAQDEVVILRAVYLAENGPAASTASRRATRKWHT